MMYEKEVKEKVTAILPQVVTWRRHFHEYPELSGKEVKTSAYIQDVFKNLGIPYETGFSRMPYWASSKAAIRGRRWPSGQTWMPFR